MESATHVQILDEYICANTHEERHISISSLNYSLIVGHTEFSSLGKAITLGEEKL